MLAFIPIRGFFPPTWPRLTSFSYSLNSFFFSSLFLSIFGLFKRQACDVAGFRMNSSLLISLVLFLATWFVTAAPNNGICYNTDQIQDGGYLPCDPEAEVSFCCKPGDICLSKGLCEPSVNTSSYDTPYFTSLCTDYSWNSPSTCLEICNNNPSRQVISYDVVLLKRVIQYKGNANIQCSLSMSNLEESLS